MAISPQEIYKKVMKLIENEAPTIKEDVFGAHTSLSYTKQEFDTKFTEFWKYNWELITHEVQADIIVFIDNETKWAEEKNKGWGGDCHRQALEHFKKYIAKTAHTNIDILKGKIIADFGKLAYSREMKLDSRVGNRLQGRGVLGGRNRYMV